MSRKFKKLLAFRTFQLDFHLDITLLVNFLRVAIIVTTFQWWLMGNQLWVIVGVTSALITFIPKYLVRDHKLRTFTNLCISALIAAHIVLGMQLGLYESSMLYDKFMHVIGLFAITGLVIAAVSQYCNKNSLVLPSSLLSILVISVSVSAGTLWEVFEFTIDLTGLFQAQRSLSDTMLDLIADTIGALAAMGLFVGYVQPNFQHTTEMKKE